MGDSHYLSYWVAGGYRVFQPHFLAPFNLSPPGSIRRWARLYVPRMSASGRTDTPDAGYAMRLGSAHSGRRSPCLGEGDGNDTEIALSTPACRVCEEVGFCRHRQRDVKAYLWAFAAAPSGSSSAPLSCSNSCPLHHSSVTNLSISDPPASRPVP